ncbi:MULTISPECIES: BPSL0067 family protein [Caballeronia]|uniref:BPSL0067 family protein n=1 Tax=Caballeronia TaxID=1827195 RepID=UPI00158986BC|nr:MULTISPECIES: BPSL0067 family protein [Caballeronia]MCG7401700.1 BPSL0067 family protein [Caballeronia zhejiangensis]MCI1045270.1 BPSL0067 family protein [Caballeronia zhejiangensis]
MSYISSNYKNSPSARLNTWVCAPGSAHGPYDDAPPDGRTGHPDYCGGCVSYVKQVCPSLPATIAWKKGAAVKNNPHIVEGTVIATFDNHRHFHGHAAIYVSQSPFGVTVYDQYAHPPKPIGPRILRWGQGSDVNNGDKFYVVE